ncbi:hypothetical protein KX816_10530 [Sphingosinicellaceae bacterium]|nr:hypothetical protein KX816_10530 [Sphingosinicellaceae bacterium]
MDRVRTARENANIALVANSPTCAWTEEIILRGDEVASRHASNALTCRPLGTAAAAGDETVSLRPIREQALKPTTETIAALAAYLDAVNAIMSAEAPDVGARLGEAFGYATKAQAALNAVTKGKLAVIPTLTAEQGNAIKDLVKLIGDLAAEQHKVRELGHVVALQNKTVGKLIASLKKQVAEWGNASLTGDLQLNDAALTELGRGLAGGRPPDPESRAELIRTIIEAKRTTDAVPTLLAAVDTSLDDMATAQADLFKAYSDHPDWTKAERTKQAKLNRERLLGALEAVAAVAGTFVL